VWVNINKANSLQVLYFSDHDQVLPPSSSPPSSIHQPAITSKIVYDAITQKLKNNGHLQTQPMNSAVDLSVKTENPNFDSENGVVAPLTIQKVMESIRQRWQNVQQNRFTHDVLRESDTEEVLTLRVPACVKSVVIERDGKRQKFELN